MGEKLVKYFMYEDSHGQVYCCNISFHHNLHDRLACKIRPKGFFDFSRADYGKCINEPGDDCSVCEIFKKNFKSPKEYFKSRNHKLVKELSPNESYKISRSKFKLSIEGLD